MLTRFSVLPDGRRVLMGVDKAKILYDKWLGEDKTGWHCANWLKSHCRENSLKFPEFAVHSANPRGKRNIQELLKDL